MVTGVVAARVLGPEDRGYLAVIVFWPQLLVSLFRLPFSDAFVVLAKAQEDQRGISSLFYAAARDALQWSGLLMPVVSIIVWIILHPYPDTIRWSSVAFGLFLMFFSQQSQLYNGLLRFEKKFNLVNAFRIFVPISYLFFSILFAVFGLGIAGFVVAHILSIILSYTIRIFLKIPAIKEKSEPFQSKQVREMRATVIRFLWSTVLFQLNGKLDRALVIATSSAVDVGVFVVAMTVAGLINGIVSTMMQSVGLPQLVSLAEERKIVVIQRLIRLTWMLAILIALATAFVSPIIVPIAFGREFIDAGYLGSAIALASVLVPVRQALTPVLLSERQENWVSVSNLAYMIVFIAVFSIGLLLGLKWAVVPALVIGNVTIVTLMWFRLTRVRRGLSIRTWITPSVKTIRELTLVVFSSRKSSR